MIVLIWRDHVAELLLQGLEKHVEERWVLMYIKRWLEAPSENAKGEKISKQGKGTQQGEEICPLLPNLFLHYALGKWLEINYPELSFVRYANDSFIHCNSETEAVIVLTAIRRRLCECQLSLNEKKTKIVYCQDYRRKKKDYKVKFGFLGFSFQPRSFRAKQGNMMLGYDCAISIESEKRLYHHLVYISPSGTGKDIVVSTNAFNLII